MRVLVAGLSTLLLAGSALAADDDVRAKLTGKWQSTTEARPILPGR